MASLSESQLISFLSVKGGTGKTTTALSLASLLAEQVPVCIIEDQLENPQYQSLLCLLGEDLNTDEEGRDYLLGRDLPSFKQRQLSVVPIKRIPKGKRLPYVWEVLLEGFRIASAAKKWSDPTKDLAQKIWAMVEHHPGGAVAFIVDHDAGLERRVYDRILPFHRGVHGYNVLESIKEIGIRNGFTEEEVQSLVHTISEKRRAYDWNLRAIVSTIYGQICSYRETNFTILPTPVCFNSDHIDEGHYSETDPLQLTSKRELQLEALSLFEGEAYKDRERFGKGFLVVVASAAIAEVNGIIDRKHFFLDLGRNNHYVLILNQTRDEDARKIESILKREMGSSYLFEKVIALPHLPYSEFGNIREGGNPHLLPVHSDKPDSRLYRERLSELVNYISNCPNYPR